MTEPNNWNGNGDWLPAIHAANSNSSDISQCPGASRFRPAWITRSKFASLLDGRRSRFLIVLATTLLLVCGVSGWVGWATTAIRPISKTQLLLLSTDYHDNFLLAPNPSGDRTVGRLASLCTNNESHGRFPLTLAGPPVDFTSREVFAECTDGLGGDSLVFFVSAHGLSTPSGPVLMPRDATKFEDAIDVRAVLQELKKLPTESPKTLVLDACQITSDHRWGVLHNDFVSQLGALNSEIESIENLTVIVDSGVDQKGWTDPSVGTTVFGNAFIEGIAGLAKDENRDGWLDLNELLDYCVVNVDQWVIERTGVHQQPTLFPRGEEGRNRAKRLALRPISDKQMAIPPALVSTTRTDLIEGWWGRYAALNQRVPHPAILTPLQWDRFVATVLRFEHFELNGARDSADWLNLQLSRMHDELSHGRPIESAAARAGVIAPTAVGVVPEQDIRERAVSVAEHLRATAPTSRPAAWQNVVEQSGEAYSTAHLRREVVALLIEGISKSLRQTKTVDRNAIADMVDTIKATFDPLQPDSTYTAVVKLLSRDLPLDCNEPEDAIRLARLLDLWSRCDRVTSREHPDFMQLEPTILPWVETLTTAADTQRRLAFDLMMGNQESRVRADNRLQQAESLYAEVDCTASVVGAAETRLRVGWNQLAWHAAAIESLASQSENLAEAQELATRLDIAYEAAAKLAQQMIDPIDVQETDDEKTCRLVYSLDRQFATAIQAIAEPLAKWHQSGRSSADYTYLTQVLTLPGGTGAERLATWDRCRQIANKPPSIERFLEANLQVPAAAKVLGQIALAPWTRRDFDRMGGDNFETLAQVKHRLEIFAVEPEWRKALATIGGEISVRYETARDLISSQTKSEENAPSLDALARRFDSLLPPSASATIDSVREQSLAGYLIAMAHRTVADCLASLDQQSTPQFARVAAVLMDDASRYCDSAEIQQLHKSISIASTLALHAETSMDWTTEQTRILQVDLMRKDDPNPGFVTITAETRSPIQLLNPAPGQRVCRPIRTSNTEPDPVAPAKIDSTLLQLAIDRDKLAATSVGSTAILSDVRLKGYFRGRTLDSITNIQVQLQPTQHAVSLPRPKTARVAVRAPQHQQTDATSGSLAIVLDCSGSMGAPRGQTFDSTAKYAQSLEAVKRILTELPTGIRLSVWTFGQAGQGTKTVVPAEQTIRRVLAPTVWDPSRQASLDSLFSKLQYPASEPWNESPMIASLIAAARDLSNQPNEFKSMIVITDGFDNRIEKDAINNPGLDSVESVIRKTFAGTGIVLNVVGFRVDQQDIARTDQALAVVEKLVPAGRYVRVEKTEDLMRALRKSLSREVRYEIRKLSDASNTPPIASFAESPPFGAIRWTNDGLEPGTYELSSASAGSSDRVLSTTIEVESGDQLLLQRTLENALVLATLSKAEIAAGDQRTVGALTTTLMPDVSQQFNTTSHQFVIEGPSNRPLALIPLGDFWADVRDADNKPVACRWYRQFRSQGIAYQVETLLNEQQARECLQTYYINPTPAVAIGQLIRDRDFAHFEDLAPAQWQDSAGVVKLRDASIETWSVPDGSGNVSPQSCFVLRVECPANSAFRLRPIGLRPQGFDEQYFHESNTYTYRAWPLTQAEVESHLEAIELLSVQESIQAAQRSGMALPFSASSASTLRTARSQ
jgi:hypothetical protein